MGVDLTLLPFDHDGGDWGFSHTVLQLVPVRAVIDKIRELDSMRVPERFMSYASRDSEYPDSHYGDTQQDAYGDPVRYVYAMDLVKLADGLPEEYVDTPEWAYLRKLPPRTKVALFWH